jgi:endoglucanase
MVTNLCPYDGNEQWCPQVGGTNEYGYSYHFDIMAESIIFGDNPVVDFEPVACPGQATSDWDTCVCWGETETDVTPVGLTSGTTNPSTTVPVATSSKSTTTATTAATTTTTTTRTTTTTTTTTTSSSSSSSGSAQALYGQCGGINWTGPTTCVSGATCTVLNPYYYQCLDS